MGAAQVGHREHHHWFPLMYYISVFSMELLLVGRILRVALKPE